MRGGVLQGMCEQRGVLTKGVLTHERRWSETILCVYAHAMPVIARPGEGSKNIRLLCDTGERLPVRHSMMKLPRIKILRPCPTEKLNADIFIYTKEKESSPHL